MQATAESRDTSARDRADAQRATRTEELFTRAADCATAERTRLHHEIVTVHLELARGIARRYRHRGVPLEDLEQTACTGLVLAVRRFDPSFGTSFLSFAVPTIDGMVKRHFRDHAWAVRPPRRVQELQAQIREVRDDLTQSLGRSPRPHEIADHLGAELDQVIEAVAAQDCFATLSLDVPASPDGDVGTLLGDLIPSADRSLELTEARVMLSPVVHRLSDRDRRILALRFFEQRTQQEIGDEVGLSQMQVSRLLARILGDLRQWLTVGPDPAGGAAS